MREKLTIRCDIKEVLEPFVKTYPQFQRRWVTKITNFSGIIEGYTDEPEFKAFYDYLQTKIKYAVSYITREYIKKELLDADILKMWISATFEPTGEEVGTEYEYPCSVCKAGRTVKGDLVLDLRKTPKGKDIAKTIADEWIVSQRLAELIYDAKLTGFELKPVRHKVRYQDDAIDPTKYRSGIELIEKAKMAGVPYSTWAFWVWLNRPEQSALLHGLEQEHIQTRQKKEIKERQPIPIWYQLIINSTVALAEQTKYGDPFSPVLDIEQIKTSCGHTITRGALSELFIKKNSWDGSDITKTDFSFGVHINLLYPAPEILISQRFYRLLEEHNIKGYTVEVTHTV